MSPPVLHRSLPVAIPPVVDASASDDEATSEPTAPRRWRWWAAVLGVWTVYGILQVALVELTKEPGKSGTRFWGPIMIAVALFWAAATPLVFWLAQRLRPSRVGWLRSATGHGAAALLLAAAVMYLRMTVRLAIDPEGKRNFLLAYVYVLDYNLITYAMVAVIGEALGRYREYAARARVALALETQLARARLQFLQRQLQPHFLFNALNAVAELARETPDTARRTLHDLQRLLRSALECADAAEVTLREELATLEPYIQIQRTRFSDTLDIACRVEPATLDACVPPLVLQPLVENAIRHGRAGRGERGRVSITARLSGDRLQLRVVDDGPSLTPRAATQPRATRERTGSGIGLRNTAERLAQLYGADHRFALFHESGAGTVAELDLPFRTSARVTRFTRPVAVTAASAAPDAGEEATAELIQVVSLQPPAPEGESAASAIATADGEPQPARRGLGWRGWAAMMAFWAAVGAYWLLQTDLVQLVVLGHVENWMRGRIDLVSAAVYAALTPVVLWLAHRVPFTRRRWPAVLAFHLLAAVAFAAVQMWVCFNVGVDDRALLLEANIDPFTLCLFIYFGLVAWSHARDFAAWYEERGLAAARTEAAIAHAHWQTVALELHPQFLLAALGTAADLTRSDAPRAERVVERLADLLRTTLDAPGRGARSVRDELAILGGCLELHREATGGSAALECVVEAATLDALVPSGAFHQAVDRVLQRAVVDPAGELRVRVETRRRAGGTELVVRSGAAPVAAPASTSMPSLTPAARARSSA